MPDKLRVFISSIIEGYQFDREVVARVCREMGVEPKLFPEEATPGSTTEYLEALVKSQILVLLVPPDESTAVEEEIRLARLHGIPFIPALRLTKSRNGRGTEISERAQQFKLQHNAEYAFEYGTLATLEEGIKTGIARIIHRRFTSPLLFVPWSPEVYEQATTFLYLAGSRLALAQVTSTLILGPHEDRLLQERKFYHELKRYLSEIADGQKNVRFLHVFDRKQTLDELAKHSEKYPERKTAFSELESLEKKIHGNEHIKIIGTDRPIMAAIVGDASFQIASMYGSRYYAWVNDFGSGANQLWEILESTTSGGVELGDFLVSVSKFVA